MLTEITNKFEENFRRLRNLIQLYDQIGANTPGRSTVFELDLLRATVVFAHSTLEDFIRSLQLWKLPESSSDRLRSIPLVGLKRNTKFGLGDLQPHQDKRIKEVILASVEEYLNQQSYNNATDVSSAIVSCGCNVTSKIE